MDDSMLRRRNIQLPGTSTLRDIGGYQTTDGLRVKWGRIYRSGAMPRFGEEACRCVQQQNVATVVDLRSDAERDLAPCSLIDRHPAGHLNASYDAALIFPPSAGFEEEGGAFNDLHQSLYAVFAETLAPTYKAMFAALLGNETPMIVHCSAGQDRTGLAIALILTVLGVPKETILRIIYYRPRRGCSKMSSTAAA